MAEECLEVRRALLSMAWEQIVQPGDFAWIQGFVSRSREEKNAPGSGAGRALEKLLQGGAEPAEITEVVRLMQFEAIFGLLYCLEDPPHSAYTWRIFQVNEDGEPIEAISAAYESLLSADPTGKELRPSGATQRGSQRTQPSHHREQRERRRR